MLVESNANAKLPLWFREGLVGYLENPAASHPAAKPPADTDLRQTADPERARRAYVEAADAVADLVRQHGERDVLSWVSKGMPNAAR